MGSFGDFFGEAGGWGGLLSALVSTGGNLAGGLLSKSPTTNPGKTSTAQSGVDPLTQALQNLALVQLGITPSGAGVTGSPFQSAISLATQRGSLTSDNLTRLTEEFNRAVGAAESGQPYTPGERSWLLDYAAQQAGYRNGTELAQAEAKFRTGRGEREAAATSQAQSNYDARTKANETLNQLISSYQAPTDASIESLRQQFKDQIFREIDQQERDARDKILQSAQLGGYNPAGAIGRTTERYGIERRNAENDSLLRALQVLQGRQSAAQNTYGLLSGALTNPVTSAQQTAQLGNAAAANASQIAAQQAMANAQQNAAITASNNQSLGNAVAGGVNSISQWLNTPATLQMMRMLKQSETQPGTGRQLSAQPGTSGGSWYDQWTGR